MRINRLVYVDEGLTDHDPGRVTILVFYTNVIAKYRANVELLAVINGTVTDLNHDVGPRRIDASELFERLMRLVSQIARKLTIGRLMT
jgi:hypothetical protein